MMKIKFFWLPTLFGLLLLSCNREKDLAKESLSEKRIYNDSFFQKVLERTQLWNGKEQRIKEADSILHLAKHPADKIACYLIQAKLKYPLTDLTGKGRCMSSIDSIVQQSGLVLKKYPAHYIWYTLIKGQLLMGDHEIALVKNMLNELEQYSLAHNKSNLDMIYLYISSYYKQNGEVSKALLFSRKSLEMVGNRTAVDIFLNNYYTLLIYEEAMNQNDSSFISKTNNLLKESIQLYKKTSYDHGLYELLLKCKIIAHNANGEYEKSCEISMEIYRHEKSLNEMSSLTLSNLAANYANANHIKEAEHYMSEAVKQAYLEKYNYGIINGLKYLSHIYRYVGKYKQASDSAIAAIQLIEKIYNEEKVRSAERIEKDYQLKLKQKEIEKLALEKNLRETMLRNTVLFFIVLILTLSFVIYIVFKRRKLKNELEKSKIKQQLFRLQISPHFIFNAISGIRGQILNNEKENAVNYLSKFSKLLRKLLESSDSEWISIQEEVDFIRDYLQVQQIRYSNKFDFTIQVDEKIDQEQVLIPSMLLQLFVENSIEHGFSAIEYQGMIEIRIELHKENVLKIVVKDNGSGMQTQKSRQMHEHKTKSMATDIARKRMEIISKETGIPSFFTLSEKSGVIVDMLVAYKPAKV